MFRIIELPLWLLILILAFAAVTALSHFLLPSVRWFFRRRMERVVAKLNERLTRPIQPFKLARRHDMIQRLLYDPVVIEAVAKHARSTGVREDVAFQLATKYAREIVPSFSATAYFGVAIKLARWLSRAFYRVRLGHFAEKELDEIDPDATVVFVMNHRSNMDYVLVTYLAAERSALSYAVGEWARVWPLNRLIRAMGAYFIRRKSRNPLYSTVLSQYVKLATANGVMQAVFPEGGLSLDGKVGAPKLGLLSYIISEFNPGEGRDIVFVPVALNYDRVLEDRVLIAAADAGVRKFRFRISTAFQYFMKHLWQRLSGRFLRFGYAAVSFGEPLSLSMYSANQDKNLVEAVGTELMGRVRRLVPVLPVPLVATCLLAADKPLDTGELTLALTDCVHRLNAAGISVRLPHKSADYAVEVALSHLVMRDMVSQSEIGIVVNPDDVALLQYYANSIAHLFDASAA